MAQRGRRGGRISGECGFAFEERVAEDVEALDANGGADGLGGFGVAVRDEGTGGDKDAFDMVRVEAFADFGAPGAAKDEPFKTIEIELSAAADLAPETEAIGDAILLFVRVPVAEAGGLLLDDGSDVVEDAVFVALDEPFLGAPPGAGAVEAGAPGFARRPAGDACFGGQFACGGDESEAGKDAGSFTAGTDARCLNGPSFQECVDARRESILVHQPVEPGLASVSKVASGGVADVVYEGARVSVSV